VNLATAWRKGAGSNFISAFREFMEKTRREIDVTWGLDRHGLVGPGEGKAKAPVSRRQTAFAFEVFGLSIPSSGGAGQHNVAGQE
jgi:hypothetical protein